MATEAVQPPKPYRLPSGTFAQALLQTLVRALTEQSRRKAAAVLNGGKS